MDGRPVGSGLLNTTLPQENWINHSMAAPKSEGSFLGFVCGNVGNREDDAKQSEQEILP